MTNKIYTGTIEAVEDVEKFFHHLIVERKMYGFHPDDGFKGYDNMTVLEAKVYAGLMDSCFDICEHAEMDLYRIGANILQTELGKQKNV